MLVPEKWLREYVDLEGIDGKTLADELTMSGSHVDSIIHVDKGVNKVVVGKILEILPHPDADKLQICKIDVGEEVLQIVTGAQNVCVNNFVPVALVGSKLPDGTKIKKGKLRGVESFGMLCSTDELGIPENVVEKGGRDGIYILDKEYTLGMDIKDALKLNGSIIEFEITPNRPDCLSILGMAREASATFDRNLLYPSVKLEKEIGSIDEYIDSIEIDSKQKCKRYYAKVVKDVKIEKSPMWLQRNLMEAGVRPINNIVDITNYVMLEIGQPLHAFDLKHIEGKKIVVRNAAIGEKITTLDGEVRELDDEMLLICDSNKSLAIAGLMGGLDSEVKEDTNTILIESAGFDSKTIRMTSKKLGLRTEASSRFEKGLDPNLAKIAANRVCALIEELGCGVVIKGEKDNYPEELKPHISELRPAKVEELLGVSIDKKDMINTLKRFDMKVEDQIDKLIVEIPTYRQDVQAEVDLIEEVGRIYGFHKIEAQKCIVNIQQGGKSDFRNAIDKAKNYMVGLGFNEITTYSFISPKSFDKMMLPEGSIKRNCVEIKNPLGEDYSVMRTSLLSNMMEVLSRNAKRKVKNVNAFEIASVFIPKGETNKGLPYEIRNLCLGGYGDEDFYSYKGYILSLLEYFGIEGLDFEPEKNHSSFHPGRTANILKDNHVIGIMGEVHPKVLEQYGVKGRFYLAELDFELIFMLANPNKTFKEIPKYPSIKRDIALVVDKEIMVKNIEKVIWDNAKKYLVSVKLFDVYTGSQIPEDKKSVAYNLEYRSNDKTLTDDEVEKIHNKILSALELSINAKLR